MAPGQDHRQNRRCILQGCRYRSCRTCPCKSREAGRAEAEKVAGVAEAAEVVVGMVGMVEEGAPVVYVDKL